MRRPNRLRSTPPGQHRAVMLSEVLQLIDPKPGMTIVDCTVGWGGHSVELLQRLGPTGLLIGLDLDADNLSSARQRLEAPGFPFHLHHANFAGLLQILAEHNTPQVDAIIADLGMSSMQVDEPERGFSYARDGTLDMRMDRSRGRTAAQLLATITEDALARALAEFGDEPQAEMIASAIIQAQQQSPITTTTQLAQIIQQSTRQEKWILHPTPGKWNLHPAARSFQALRILVNRELGNLDNLLRIVPSCLIPGGTVAVISFHSGEDRLVKSAFRTGLEMGAYGEISPDPLRADWQERTENPRARSAKLRWAKQTRES